MIPRFRASGLAGLCGAAVVFFASASVATAQKDRSPPRLFFGVVALDTNPDDQKAKAAAETYLASADAKEVEAARAKAGQPPRFPNPSAPTDERDLAVEALRGSLGELGLADALFRLALQGATKPAPAAPVDLSASGSAGALPELGLPDALLRLALGGLPQPAQATPPKSELKGAYFWMRLGDREANILELGPNDDLTKKSLEAGEKNKVFILDETKFIIFTRKTQGGVIAHYLLVREPEPVNLVTETAFSRVREVGGADELYLVQCTKDGKPKLNAFTKTYKDKFMAIVGADRCLAVLKVARVIDDGQFQLSLSIGFRPSELRTVIKTIEALLPTKQ